MSVTLTANRHVPVACMLVVAPPHARSLSASSDATDDGRNEHALSGKSHMANGRRNIFFPTMTPPPPRPQISKLGEVSPKQILRRPPIRRPRTLKFGARGALVGGKNIFRLRYPWRGRFPTQGGMHSTHACLGEARCLFVEAGSAGMWRRGTRWLVARMLSVYGTWGGVVSRPKVACLLQPLAGAEPELKHAFCKHMSKSPSGTLSPSLASRGSPSREAKPGRWSPSKPCSWRRPSPPPDLPPQGPSHQAVPPSQPHSATHARESKNAEQRVPASHAPACLEGSPTQLVMRRPCAWDVTSHLAQECRLIPATLQV